MRSGHSRYQRGANLNLCRFRLACVTAKTERKLASVLDIGASHIGFTILNKRGDIMKHLSSALAAVLASIAATISVSSVADSYPSKPIRMIVGYGPGSGADIIGRILADKLSEQMKVSVVVENKDGAGGAIGTAAAAKSPGDGYTILLSPTTLTVSPSLMTPAPYEVKDFTAVTKVAILPMAIVTNANAPFKTFQEFIDYAKANPGKITYATSGKGSPSHLEMELIRQRYSLELVDAPYKAGGQAMTDTISGQVPLYFPVLPAALQHIKAGLLRGLVVGSSTPSEKAPGIPTLADAMKVPGYEASVWYGVMVPKATPDAIVARLDTEIQKALTSPQVREKIEATGSEVSVLGREKFGPFVHNETEKWDKLVKQLNLKVVQ
jgi:tripartite-type tricarboxylate transporter receptor subunit TctC